MKEFTIKLCPSEFEELDKDGRCELTTWLNGKQIAIILTREDED